MIRNIREQVSGFTIIEVIIVLTITVALLSSALLLFNSRVPRSQFETSVNELVNQLTDSFNQVATGNYPTSENFNCSVSGGGLPVISPSGTTVEQGTLQDCLYVGQAIQFGENGSPYDCPNGGDSDNCDTLNFFTVVGRRTDPSSDDIASSIDTSTPIISEDLFARYTTGYGMFFKDARVRGVSGPSGSIGGIAFTLSFGTKVSGSGNPSGAPQVQLVPLSDTSIGMPISGAGAGFVEQVSYPTGRSINTTPNPTDGVDLCLESPFTGQYAIITIGADGIPTSISKRIYGNSTEGQAQCG